MRDSNPPSLAACDDADSQKSRVERRFRAQILGQLSDWLSYDQLYRDALSDPELKRTRHELVAAISNATEARQVVFQLFQDQDGFNLDDYEPHADIDGSKARLRAFVQASIAQEGGREVDLDDKRFRIEGVPDFGRAICTLNRDLAQRDDSVELIGVDHPLLVSLFRRWRESLPEDIVAVATTPDGTEAKVLSVWFVQSLGRAVDTSSHIVPIAVDASGNRVPTVENKYSEVFQMASAEPSLEMLARRDLLSVQLEPLLERELKHRGIARISGGHTSDLIAWIEFPSGRH